MRTARRAARQSSEARERLGMGVQGDAYRNAWRPGAEALEPAGSGSDDLAESRHGEGTNSAVPQSFSHQRVAFLRR